MSYVLLAAEGGNNPLIPVLPELVAGIIAFSLLFFVLRKYVTPMFEKAFADRTAAIQGGLEKAEKAQAEAALALSTYQAQLAEARGESSRLREEAREQGAAIIEDMRAQAQAESARIVTAAHSQIEAERQQALTSLRHEIGSLATSLASKIVGEALEDQVRQSGVVDRFLSDLEAAN
ncbi:MAG TPA: F0F1 ATP synthase subunit B [Candidatus Nanopelagicaceae bacterium]|nr:F0F1 ATP synthase subunit B [Candidatus Nanopelagicaceae bacterium]